MNLRTLPWRATKDPYFIWLSEIILQQTRVAQGLPYYEVFAHSYPNIVAFAQAPLDDILKKWQGLGYYSRARNMHICANQVVDDLDGKFPNSFVGLQKLQGIGKYTAAAIASISFNEAVPAVDGNAFRVYSRLFGIDLDIAKPATFKYFFEIGEKIIPKDNPGDFNQGIMEMGSSICSPKKPSCEQCPVLEYCFAHSNQNIEKFPIKKKTIKVRHRYFDYIYITHSDKTLIKKRPDNDIWAGLHDFMLVESDKEAKIGTFELGSIIKNPDRCLVEMSLMSITHQLTHQKLHINFHQVEMSNWSDFELICQEYELKMVDISNINNLAVPKPIELFISKVV